MDQDTCGFSNEDSALRILLKKDENVKNLERELKNLKKDNSECWNERRLLDEQLKIEKLINYHLRKNQVDEKDERDKISTHFEKCLRNMENEYLISLKNCEEKEKTLEKELVDVKFKLEEIEYKNNQLEKVYTLLKSIADVFL